MPDLPTGSYSNSGPDPATAGVGEGAAPDEHDTSVSVQMTSAELAAFEAYRAAAAKPRKGSTSGQSGRLDRIEGALERLVGAMTPQESAPASAAPARTPAPTAAPAVTGNFGLPSSKVESHTENGLTNVFRMTPAQLEQLGPWGIREAIEKAVAVGNDLSGRPRKPQPPSMNVKVRK